MLDSLGVYAQIDSQTPSLHITIDTEYTETSKVSVHIRSLLQINTYLRGGETSKVFVHIQHETS